MSKATVELKLSQNELVVVVNVSQHSSSDRGVAAGLNPEHNLLKVQPVARGDRPGNQQQVRLKRDASV